MGDRLKLALNRTIDLRMLMTVQIRPDRGVRVEIFLPARIFQHRAPAFHDDDRLVLKPVPHLRERMPDEFVIEFGERMHRFTSVDWRLRAGHHLRFEHLAMCEPP